MRYYKDKKQHFILREINRLKRELFFYALGVIIFILIAFIVPDGTKVFLEGIRFFVAWFIIQIITFLYEFWLIAINNKNPIILAIDENGVLLRAIGRSPKKNYFHKRYHVFSKVRFMSFEWDEIDHLVLRITSVPGYYYYPESCVHVKSKTGEEYWCSIEDYSIWLPSTSRRIRHAVYECTGRTDLFIDTRHQRKQ